MKYLFKNCLRILKTNTSAAAVTRLNWYGMNTSVTRPTKYNSPDNCWSHGKGRSPGERPSWLFPGNEVNLSSYHLSFKRIHSSILLMSEGHFGPYWNWQVSMLWQFREYPRRCCYTTVDGDAKRLSLFPMQPVYAGKISILVLSFTAKECCKQPIMEISAIIWLQWLPARVLCTPDSAFINSLFFDRRRNRIRSNRPGGAAPALLCALKPAVESC